MADDDLIPGQMPRVVLEEMRSRKKRIEDEIASLEDIINNRRYGRGITTTIRMMLRDKQLELDNLENEKHAGR